MGGGGPSECSGACYNRIRHLKRLNRSKEQPLCPSMNTFEKIVINKQQEIACPKCASKKASIQLSVFATANGSSNGASAKSSSSSGSGGSCCGGGCGCN